MEVIYIAYILQKPSFFFLLHIVFQQFMPNSPTPGFYILCIIYVPPKKTNGIHFLSYQLQSKQLYKVVIRILNFSAPVSKILQEINEIGFINITLFHTIKLKRFKNSLYPWFFCWSWARLQQQYILNVSSFFHINDEFA